LALVVLIAGVALPLPAEEAPATGEVPAAEELHGPVVQFAVDTASDLGGYVTAPLRFDGRDWLMLGATTGAIAGLGIAYDDRLRESTQAHQNAGADGAAKDFNLLGSGASLAILAGAWGYGALAASPTSTGFARDGLEASVIASVIIASVVKFAAGRTRPDEADPGRWEPFSGNSSFPSGHTTQAFALASVAAATWSDRPWVGAVAFTLASGVGAARVYGNHHYLSDVLAGAALGTTVGWYVVQRNHGRRASAAPQVAVAADRLGLEWHF
jgi:membrane-associated phospholipid phosphatase